MNYKSIVFIAGFLLVGMFLGWLFFGITAGQGGDARSGGDLGEMGAAEQTWTCSMHPQIRLPDFVPCPICGMDLIPASDAGSSGSARVVMSDEAMALANVQVSRVEYQKAYREIRLPGTVAIDERKVAKITAHIPHARIERLYVNFEGDFVNRGDKVAAVYSPDLVTVQKELFESLRYGGDLAELAEMARNKLRYWKLTEQQIKDIEASGEVSEVVDIFSHQSGFVTQLNVAIGDHVMEGHVLAEVADLDRVWVIFDAYERDLRWISKGNEIEIHLRAMPGTTFTSRVSYIDPLVNPSSSTVRVRAELDNAAKRIKPGMLVSGIVYGLASGERQLVVPKSAVLWTGKRSVVFVREGGENEIGFALRQINLGPETGEGYVVLDGLQPGEEVVSRGAFLVDAAAQLQGMESMMSVVESDQLIEEAEIRYKVSHTVGAAFSRIMSGYYEVKNALVGSDQQRASQAAAALIPELEGLEIGSLSAKATVAWLEISRDIRESLEMLRLQGDVAEQRIRFQKLSKAVRTMAQSFGSGGKTVYEQYCPMAFNDKGAFWLSESRDILNPYFGDEMLRCGEVSDSLR